MQRLKLPAVMDNLDQMIDFVLDALDEEEFAGEEKFKSKLHLACEEAMVNIIHYAYGDEVGDIEIVYEFIAEEAKLILKLIDAGVAFNPLEEEEPDVDIAVEERAIGGLGIYMVKQVMDEVEYKRDEGKNILILIKDLSKIS